MKAAVTTTIDDLVRALRTAAHAGANRAADMRAQAVARDKADHADRLPNGASEKDSSP